jgi:hypothetical protein
LDGLGLGGMKRKNLAHHGKRKEKNLFLEQNLGLV